MIEMTRGPRYAQPGRTADVGDPRLTPSDREILRRITTGDLADEFADELTRSSDADPLVGGAPDPH